jgi:hypothetical protein
MEESAAIERRRAGAALPNPNAARRLSGRSMFEDRWTWGRRRRDGVDQSATQIGEGEAEVADLARLVRQGFGFVGGEKQLGEHQRAGNTNRA